MSIRNLRRDEPVPEEEPRRYKNAKGYVRLRWKINPHEYVEDFEHRIVMGRPEGEVHHLNHDPSDNRIENLVVLSEEEHHRLHAEEKSFRHLHDTIIQFYSEGLSTLKIGRQLGINHGTVSRILKKEGVPARSFSFSGVPVNPDDIRRWHAQGVRADEMARRTGAGRKRIDNMLDELGLPRFRPGNPGGR